MIPDYEQKLLHVARTASSSSDRRTALVKLRDMRSEAARSLMVEIVLHERRNQNLRETAIKALGEIGIQEDLEMLRQIADGETEEPARFARDAAMKAHMRLSSRLKAPSTASGQPRSRSTVSPSVRYDVFRRDENKCRSCGRNVDDGVTLHVDHIVPASRGGSNAPDNLQTLCDDCNQGKSNRDSRDLRVKK